MFFQLTIFLLTIAFMSLSYANNIEQFNQAFVKNVRTKLVNKGIPGGAYAIVKDNKVIALETFGHIDKAKSQKVNKETVFRLASVSKPFSATVATMLAHKKQLNLSDPVTKFIPQFTLAKTGAAERIQLKHVLSHSSGLIPNAYDNLLHENWSMEKIISRFKRISPICQPAKCYGYQNIAYSFIEPAIEASQNKSYEQLISSEVFKPLKMMNASVGFDAFNKEKNSAKPHILRKRINTGRKDKNGYSIKRYIWRTVDVEPDFYEVSPAAGVNASITDLAKWLIANLGHKPEVLSPALITELTTPRIRTKKDLNRRYWREYLTDAHYGYGWRIYQFQGSPIIYHSGWVAGYRADIGYSPELGIGFAMLINAESNIINKISSEFWAKMHAQLKT